LIFTDQVVPFADLQSKRHYNFLASVCEISPRFQRSSEHNARTKVSVTVCLIFVVRIAHGPAPCSIAAHTLTLNISSLLLYALSRPRRIASSAGRSVMCLWALCVTRHVLTRRPNARIFRETNACATSSRVSE